MGIRHKAVGDFEARGAGWQGSITDNFELACQSAPDEIVLIDADEVFVADIPVIDPNFDVGIRLEYDTAAEAARIFGAKGGVADIFGKQGLAVGRGIAIAGTGVASQSTR